MATSKKAAAKKELVIVNDDILFEDQGAGQEGIGTEDLMVPRIKIIQKMSGEVNKRDGKFVEGAEVGYIHNSVTGEAVDGEKGIIVLPIKYRRAHLEWKPDRGGLAQDHGSSPDCLSSCDIGEKGEHLTSEGNEIVPTGEYFVFVINEGGNYSPAIISMAKSQLKKARRWNSMMNQLKLNKPDGSGMFTPAMFYASYQLTTVPEDSGVAGQDWFGWDIEMINGDSGGIIKSSKNGQEIYMAARSFRESITSGDVQVAPQEGEVPF
jgi:hypothetical protein